MFGCGLTPNGCSVILERVVRTRVRRRRTLALGVVALVTLGAGPVGHALRADAAARSSRTVVVRPGDSLWEIARRLEPQTDPRAVVHAIASANPVDPADLQAGQRLVVPES